MGDAIADVAARQKVTQVIVETLLSHGELGLQEFETSRYLTALLRENGFSVEKDRRAGYDVAPTRVGHRAVAVPKASPAVV